MILDRVENFLFRMESFFRVEKGWADEVLIPQAQAQPTISRTYHMSVHIWPAIISPSVPYLREILIFAISKKQVCKIAIRLTFHRPSWTHNSYTQW
jgi:fatty-acid desaturase